MTEIKIKFAPLPSLMVPLVEDVFKYSYIYYKIYIFRRNLTLLIHFYLQSPDWPTKSLWLGRPSDSLEVAKKPVQVPVREVPRRVDNEIT